ncbi:MAG: class I SAM-dependent methyltransferase [Acidobacteria bacterium]|nr:class I SAM-dependent methyltransferase [Acidobacteriota bacterium]
MPFPISNLEEVYVDADQYFHGHDVDRKKQNGLELMRQFELRLGKSGRFLDVGCGVGELLWAAKESGWQAEGVDPSSEFIEIGKQRLGVEGRVATLEAAAFPDKYFDAIAMSSIIEHLYEPFEVLREVHRVLSDDGWLFFDAPNEDGLYMRTGNIYMRLRRRNWVVVLAPTFPPYHVQGFNMRSLKVILKRAGFRLRELDLAGGICEQQGAPSIQKKIEFAAAKLVNSVGRLLKMGSYMSVWATKSGR